MSIKDIQTVDQYDEFIKEEGLKVVKLYASWCSPCQVYAPIFEAVQKKYMEKEGIAFAGIDVDQLDPEELGLEGIFPTTLFVKHGKVIDIAIGVQEENELEARIHDFL